MAGRRWAGPLDERHEHVLPHRHLRVGDEPDLGDGRAVPHDPHQVRHRAVVAELGRDVPDGEVAGGAGAVGDASYLGAEVLVGAGVHAACGSAPRTPSRAWQAGCRRSRSPRTARAAGTRGSRTCGSRCCSSAGSRSLASSHEVEASLSMAWRGSVPTHGRGTPLIGGRSTSDSIPGTCPRAPARPAGAEGGWRTRRRRAARTRRPRPRRAAWRTRGGPGAGRPWCASAWSS